MGMPKSVIRFKTKKGKCEVLYESNVDAAQYTIRELTRAALRDVGKYVSRVCNTEASHLKGLRKARRVRGKTSAFQYWNRAQSMDLQVGIKHGTWYGTHQELGSSKVPKLGILRNSTYNNIAEIVKIESQYLSALSGDVDASALNEGDYQGGADD